jgi:hypothetical protein
VVALGSCVYDGERRCSAHQLLNTDNEEACICEAHFVATADGCVPEPPTASTGGTPSTGGQGSAGAPAAGGGSGGDTTGTGGTPSSCENDDDCSDGFACNTKLSPSECVELPDGLGKACTSNTDCEGTEATFCDSVVTKGCTVEGCTVDPDSCPPGFVCCQLAIPGLPASLCALGACL